MNLVVPLADRAKRLFEIPPPEITEGLSRLPEQARTAATDALNRGETHYTDRPGILPLREKVSRWLEHNYSITVNPKTSVVITCGDTEARFVALQRFLGAGDTLLCLGDTSLVKPALAIRGANLIDAQGEVEGRGVAKGLYLSATAPEDLRDKWLAEAKARGWWLIFDVTEDKAFDFHPATDSALSTHTVTIGGVGYSQGLRSWRVGFLAAPDKEAPELRSFKQSLTICTTNVSQWAALALFEGDA